MPDRDLLAGDGNDELGMAMRKMTMTLDDAAKILANMYREGAARRETATHVHLFGIKYAEQLDGMPLTEVTARAGISDTYKTEIRKGMNLARYVRLK